MKVKIPDYFKFASLGLIGLAFAQNVHAALINHAVGEASFGAAVAGGGQYSYASTASWTNNNDTDNNWFYNAAYVTGTSDKRPFPRTGDVALHGLAGYTSQLLGDTFVAGREYTFSVYGSGDTDSDAVSDRHWLYIYSGTTIPGAFSEGTELVRARYLRDGTLDSFAGTGLGASSGSNPGWSIGDGSSTAWQASGGTWGLLTLTYTATAAEDGHPIGIAMWGAGDASFDDVSVTSIPEPSLSALLGLAGSALLLRRRRRTAIRAD